MATIAEVQLSAEETLLGTTFERVPDLECEMEQVIAADDFGLWMRADETGRSTLEAALAADPTVEAYERVTTESTRWLYTIECTDAVAELFFLVVEGGGTILTASGSNGRWTLRLRFPDRESIGQVHERLIERGLSVNLVRIYDLSNKRTSELDLTDEQYETLVAAINRGYFDIPRKISMEELADELGISHQATSERLRRAYRTLVTAELGPETDFDFDSDSESDSQTGALEGD